MNFHEKVENWVFYFFVQFYLFLNTLICQYLAWTHPLPDGSTAIRPDAYLRKTTAYIWTNTLETTEFPRPLTENFLKIGFLNLQNPIKSLEDVVENVQNPIDDYKDSFQDFHKPSGYFQNFSQCLQNPAKNKLKEFADIYSSPNCQKGVGILSFGSLFDSKKFTVEQLSEFRRSFSTFEKLKFCFILKIDHNNSSFWPPNTFHFSWIPQQTLLGL